ncbi:T-complex protein 11-domain-containing protein [Exophiala viscosa]|uniref:T-complex protein 11-domain-containing protein n=1 Tax=Exophiala viscosa TaxID=2486360 RepID=UPI002199D302|nr:T-complex protein 11-domain-containing protein [Exophiala viscosa]
MTNSEQGEYESDDSGMGEWGNERVADRSGRAQKAAITDRRFPADATNYRLTEPSASFTSTAMASSMRPKVGVPGKGNTQTGGELDFTNGSDAALGTLACEHISALDYSIASTVATSLSVERGSLVTESEQSEECSPDKRLIPPCTSEEDRAALLHATFLPPVTKGSLEELDLDWIQSNINLRVDLNYDHDLHFTPVSGHKGRQKKEEAVEYWLSLAAELRIAYQHGTLDDCASCPKASPPSTPPYFTPRLSQMFLSLQDLLLTLVPDHDREQVNQYFDIELLLQEVSHGLLDVIRLAQWLCGLLTTHCAPMRDELAQEMAEQIQEGAEKGDLQTLVQGIEKLFAFLEAMKLDVANHQIRSFRYHLIEDTVAFQQDYFHTRLWGGKVNANASKQWYEEAVRKHHECSISITIRNTPAHSALIHGLVELCCSPSSVIPETLKHDQARLQTIRNEIQDVVHLVISLTVFDHFVQHILGGQRPVSTVQTQIRQTRKLLESRIMDLTDGTMARNKSITEVWSQNHRAIALELTRAAWVACGRNPALLVHAEVDSKAIELSNSFRSHGPTTARVLRKVLEKATHDHAKRFHKMTTLAISEDQRQWHQVRQQRQQGRNRPGIEEPARMLAHVAVVHWRVWADLVYLAQ